MASTIDSEKKELRRRVRSQLAALTREELSQSDGALFARFLALPQVEEAKTIFAFWGIPGKEPDTAQLIRELLRRGKTVGLPRMLPDHRMEVRRYDPDKPLVTVSFGISEPGEDCPLLEREEISLALVPAVCYDRRGYRLLAAPLPPPRGGRACAGGRYSRTGCPPRGTTPRWICFSPRRRACPSKGGRTGGR